ncbi:MAG: chromosome segregation protein SMC [Ectothiorhodospiraceae bacterium]|nr:chromosome segregation protein SMC [Ectothiorhodospiraceae bacterium]
MRLKKIKLAGFKSFVDPTTVDLPSSLVGIVGPNGCGKSNVIDAVRWVMGESSARYLRGESMTDVIFNGSSSRKPVSQASIELIFDNADGSLGGQYASFAEISVKRVVNRDGQSQYLLNGTRCRRRDITDVFLGTGLGPRSYAIIEQGMISRIIEAKPEELRVYLEEAAGISLYKERRKETERRIRGTRENMERLNDVRDEVGSQLEKLRRQAQTAERYKTLKKDERQLRAELLAMRLRDLGVQVQAGQSAIQEQENALEARLAQQRGAERQQVESRERQSEYSEQLNAVQGRYYSLGSDIARIEQQISHRRELRQRHERDLQVNADALSDVDRTLEQDREKLQLLEQRLGELREEIAEADELEAEASDRVIETQQALDAWRESWERFNRDSAESVQAAQVERARIEGLEQRQQDMERRRRRLQDELDGLDTAALGEELGQYREQEAEGSERRDQLLGELDALDQRLGEMREQEDQLTDSLHDLRGVLQQHEARLTSLQTIQQNALGESDQAMNEWLARHGLDALPRLAHEIRVEPGVEQAVETVLAERLQALCITEPVSADWLADAPEAGRPMFIGTSADPGAWPAGRVPLPLLMDHVEAPWPLPDLLGGIHLAGNLAEALSGRDALGPHESIVTRDGYWLGARWSWLPGRSDDGRQGVLARERDIQALEESLSEQRSRLDELAERQQGVEEQRLDLEESRQAVQQAREDVGEQLADLRAGIGNRQQRLEQQQSRHQQLEHEVRELAEQIDEAAAGVRESRQRLQAALERNEEMEEQRDVLQQQRDKHQRAVTEARDAMRERRESRHGLSLKLESASTAAESLREQLRRLEEQRERLLHRSEELREALESDRGDPEEDLAAQRETLLAQRLDAERALNEARARLSEIDEQLRSLDRSRLEAEQAVEELRQQLEAVRLQHQELRVRRQTQSEQLLEMGYDLETLQDNLPVDAAEGEWLKRLSDVEQRINRLGSINLAAIEESEQLAERKEYLDQQHEDLSQALETLESAIRKIDRETRQRFKETFDKVNAGLQRMYPRLFGGGEAYLEMTGEDLLETGITILARPPGKRITNIHLLSGGEKALTAVAMIFSIFELNPAPFCMLDEVDAPLDEANVGRFSQLVKEMSSRVQFIFITHNKATMEVATHLMGVTMHEPGVSRLVAVDVDEAADMAVA